MFAGPRSICAAALMLLLSLLGGGRAGEVVNTKTTDRPAQPTLACQTMTRVVEEVAHEAPVYERLARLDEHVQPWQLAADVVRPQPLLRGSAGGARAP